MNSRQILWRGSHAASSSRSPRPALRWDRGWACWMAGDGRSYGNAIAAMPAMAAMSWLTCHDQHGYLDQHGKVCDRHARAGAELPAARFAVACPDRLRGDRAA